ncbi:MAG: ABC transporter substrate-binding protein [Paracoccaceae bacterium]
MTARFRAVGLIVTLGLLAALFPAEAQKPGRVYRVGLIFTTSPVSEMMGSDPTHPNARAFVHALRDLGYVEGQNIVIERRSAEGRFDRFGEVISELLRLKADAIVTTGDAMTQQAKELTATVPIVMGASWRPVEKGLVASLARPGGNVTGITADAGPELEGKRLEVLKEAIPGARQVAFLGMNVDWEGPQGKSVRGAADALAVAMLWAEHTPNDYTKGFGLIAQERPDALFVVSNPPNFAHRHRIVEFAARNRLPAIYPVAEFVTIGGLMSYGISAADLYHRAAYFVDKILKGAKPADLPVEQPSKFELVINLKTAKALGLTIPDSILFQADRVIK